MRKARVELERLEDGGYTVAGNLEQLADAAVVDRARSHPLVEGELGHGFGAEAGSDQRHDAPVVQVREEHVLAAKPAERAAVESVEREIRIEVSGVVGEQAHAALAHRRPASSTP